MRLYGLRVVYVPLGTSGGWNVTDVDRVRGVGDLVRILRDTARSARLIGFSVFDTEGGGGGGGGAGGTATTAGGAGGAGGQWGGGGGGGGASLNGAASGAGGKGGDGIVVVFSW